MKIERRSFFGESGRFVSETDFVRVETERDRLQRLLNERDEEVDRLRLALSAQQAPKPSPRFVAPVDCEDCGDTGIEPCSRHATIGAKS